LRRLFYPERHFFNPASRLNSDTKLSSFVGRALRLPGSKTIADLALNLCKILRFRIASG
jgi:hypothetical protein